MVFLQILLSISWATLCLSSLCSDSNSDHDTSGGICHLPRQPGMCKAYMPRFYYNSKSDKCEKFIYGGCGGNGNNFKTWKDCASKCTTIPKKCLLPKLPGPCRGSLPRWYYNGITNRCEKFTYGGCRGNRNNFRSCNKCIDKCGEYKKQCHLPKKVGRCRAAKKRFYYNSKVGRCQRFTYGGCRGNKNNFRNYCKCQDKCMHETKCYDPAGGK